MNKKCIGSIVLISVFSLQLFAQKEKREQVKSSQTAYEKYIDANNDAHLKEFIELVSQTRC